MVGQQGKPNTSEDNRMKSTDYKIGDGTFRQALLRQDKFTEKEVEHILELYDLGMEAKAKTKEVARSAFKITNKNVAANTCCQEYCDSPSTHAVKIQLGQVTVLVELCDAHLGLIE